MKTFDIDVHFDASIRMHGIIAESEEQAREIARRTAKEMNLFAAAVEREDAGEKVAESHELTPQEIRCEEREQVQELVPWLLEQQTPTEWHYYAHGGAFDWTCYQSEDTTQWERQLFASIANGTHKDTELFNRYARLLSRQRWQEHADTLYSDWDEAWQQGQARPEDVPRHRGDSRGRPDGTRQRVRALLHDRLLAGRRHGRTSGPLGSHPLRRGDKPLRGTPPQLCHRSALCRQLDTTPLPMLEPQQRDPLGTPDDRRRPCGEHLCGGLLRSEK